MSDIARARDWARRLREDASCAEDTMHEDAAFVDSLADGISELRAEVKRLTDSRQMYIESVLELEEQVKALTTERDTLMHERAVIVADHDEIARECAELRAKVAGLEGRLEGAGDAGWNDAINEAVSVAVDASSNDFCEECRGRGEDSIINAIRELRK